MVIAIYTHSFMGTYINYTYSMTVFGLLYLVAFREMKIFQFLYSISYHLIRMKTISNFLAVS